MVAVADQNLYEVLGIDETASVDEVKKAHRRLAKSLHPDAGGPAALFTLVSFAHETLSDERKRAAYDRELHRPPPVVEELRPEPDNDDAPPPYAQSARRTEEGDLSSRPPAHPYVTLTSRQVWARRTIGAGAVLVCVPAAELIAAQLRGDTLTAPTPALLVTLAAVLVLLGIRSLLRPMSLWEWGTAALVVGVVSADPTLLISWPALLGVVLVILWVRFLFVLRRPADPALRFGDWARHDGDWKRASSRVLGSAGFGLLRVVTAVVGTILKIVGGIIAGILR